ncbi:unnamed protein product [Arabidopsis halleri]
MPRRPSGRRRLSKYQPLAFSPFMRSLAFASTARRKLPLPDTSFGYLFVFAIMLCGKQSINYCIVFLCVQDNKCFRELKEFLLKVCSEKKVASDLELLVEKKAKDVGLLVSQREKKAKDVGLLVPQLLPHCLTKSHGPLKTSLHKSFEGHSASSHIF